MAVTGLDIVEAACAEIGVMAAGEALPQEDAEAARKRLNRMLDQWNARRLFCYVIAHNAYAFTTSKQSYTIGRYTPVGGTAPDFAGDRPVRIERANLIRTGVTPNEYQPLEVIEVPDFAELSIRAESSLEPDRIYYQPTFPNGTIWPWPYPTVVTNQLELFTWTQFSEFTDLFTDFYFPPGYQEAITQSLAELLAVPFGKTVAPELANSARKARTVIASINSLPPKISRDSGVPMSEAWS